MLAYATNRYVAGTYKTQCQRCGFEYLRSELHKEIDTRLIVCDKCLDEHNPRLKPKYKYRQRRIKIDTGYDQGKEFYNSKNILWEDNSFVIPETGNLTTEDGDNLIWE